MKKTSSFSKLAACVGVAACGLVTQAHAEDSPIAHVLLISVDGLHALDVARYVESHPNSALAELSEHGATYTSARTPANSDSFPRLLALVTGGSPARRRGGVKSRGGRMAGVGGLAWRVGRSAGGVGLALGRERPGRGARGQHARAPVMAKGATPAERRPTTPARAQAQSPQHS